MTIDRLKVPAPWFVAGNPIDIATSISVNDITDGAVILDRNRLLPTPAVPVTVPAFVTTVPAALWRSKFCKSLTPLPVSIMVMLDPPLVRLIPDPATKVVCDGPDTLMEPFPAPTLTPPIPDTANTLP